MVYNKWQPPSKPPPPLFLGKKERNLVKQVNDEIIERVIGQTVLYFPVSIKHTQFHPLYGEAIEKNFLPPIRVHALIKFEGIETTTDNFGLDKKTKLTVNFHKRRLTQDQNLYVREGDFIFYGGRFYEIMTANIPRQLFGQAEHRFEIISNCISARQGLFEYPAEIDEVLEKFRELTEDGQLVDIRGVLEDCRGRITMISAADTSPDLVKFNNYIQNAQNYNGCIIYITELGTLRPEPFTIANKFYYNEDGIWYGSPFIFLGNSLVVDPNEFVESFNGVIEKISAADNSPQLSQFIDYVENPQNYVGHIVYITELGSFRPEPFVLENKYYYNEAGTWYTSPYIFEIFEDGPFDWGIEEEL